MDTAKEYQTFIYNLIANNGGTSIYHTEDLESPLTNEIKVTSNIGRAKTKTKFWLSESMENGTYGQPTTALFDVGQLRWNYGDLENKKHLLIFEYRKDRKLLKIYYFKDFYPRNPRRFTISFIKD